MKIASIILIIFLAIFYSPASYSQNKSIGSPLDVGIAVIDITPQFPIRLTGYAARKNKETSMVLSPLSARAIAFGSDEQNPSLIITVDLVGITKNITEEVSSYLQYKYGIQKKNLVISASHTHGGPEVGNLINILQYREGGFNDSLLAKKELFHISEYVSQLIHDLKDVADSALEERKPRLVSWGQGQAFFARNRRDEGGPVDLSLPILKIDNLDGSLKAVYLNYACHGTTLGGDINEVHGDWIVEAKRDIEERHPEAIAIISLGTAGDINPYPRGSISDVESHGEEIADNVDKLLNAHLEPINNPPTAVLKWIRLPLSRGYSIPEMINLSKEESVKGYEARLTLERTLRDVPFPTYVDYPIQVFNFDNKMAMINMGGEVVVDYSYFLKNKYGADDLWINAYTNHVPSYIPSRRILKEGGYEGETNMYWYDKPVPYSPDVEDLILNTIEDLLPKSFKQSRPEKNELRTVSLSSDGNYYLNSWEAGTEGSQIKYMPEWKAFGWFDTQDRAIWNVDIKTSAEYDVFIEYSVSDKDGGKVFNFNDGKRKLEGRIQSTGSWFTYKNVKLGSIKLKKGRNRLSIESGNIKEKGSLFDLRKIILKRIR